MKKTLLIIGIVICVLVALFYLFVLSGAFAILMPKPPAPQMTYGKFPFSIIYEVDGEIKIYEDALVCEFDGFKHYGTGGVRREWKSYLKSGNVNICLLKTNDNELTYEISTTAGLPEYYMGDFKYGQDSDDYEHIMHDERYLGYTEIKDGKTVVKSISMEKEEVYKRFKLRIVERKYSKPIENKFE